MAMHLGDKNDDDLLIEINTTPLIDVMLVLLIMLIITIPLQTHAVKLDMPQASTEQPQTRPAVINLYIDFDGTILWNKEVISGREELEVRLQNAADQELAPEFHLRPHKLVAYKDVAMVLAAAQRLGLKKIGIIGSEEFME